MALFDIFTGDPYKDAAAQQRQYLAGVGAQGYQLLNQAQQGGLGALQSGQYGALGAIPPAIAQGRADISGAQGPAISALYGGQDLGAAALNAGQAGALGALQGAVGAYAPVSGLASLYGGYTSQASQATADALGLNGPEGVARATGQFQAEPGYQFAVGQGLDAITRAAAAGGMGAGGNVLRESQTFGQGLANQQWQNYLANLQQRQGLYAPLALSGAGTAAGGIAGALTNQANVYTGTGGRLADLYSMTGRAAAPVYTGTGQSLADLASRGGLAQANIYGQFAPAEANVYQNIGQQQTGLLTNLAQPYASTYGAEAAAQTGGSANIWNLLGNLGTTTLKAYGVGGFGPPTVKQ